MRGLSAPVLLPVEYKRSFIHLTFGISVPDDLAHRLAVSATGFYFKREIGEKCFTDYTGQLEDWPHLVSLMVRKAERGTGTRAIWSGGVFL
jgi:hypothetical protein